MNRIDNATIAHNMKWGMILVVGLIISLFLGVTLASDTRKGLAIFFMIVFPLIWVMVGTRYWWLPLPFGLAIGGIFQFGFKIYPHELGIALAIGTLAVALPLRWKEFIQHRTPISTGLLALCVYLVIHWTASLLYNKYMGIGGAGNVTRTYTTALWPVAFIFAFHLFGKSEQFKLMLYMMLGILICRVLMGYFAYLTQTTFFVPVINYIPAAFTGASDEGNTDFRGSGVSLACYSMLASLLVKQKLLKLLWLGMFFFGTVTIFIGGGRGAAAGFLFFPLLLMVIYKRWLMFVTIGTVAVLLLGAINMFPQMLNTLPYMASRTLSVFLIEKEDLDTHGDVSSSDAFHDILTKEGLDRWSESWNTIVFGTGIRPFNQDMYDPSTWDPHFYFMESIKNAANTGNYEAGLINVLAVTGVVGLILYLNAFRAFFMYLWRALWKDKICDPGHALGFLGISVALSWLVLSWRIGTWPSESIFYMYLGYVHIQDQRDRVKEEGQQESNSPGKQSVPRPTTIPGRGPEYGNPAYS